jgi:DNA-binding transcriptional ArsR family regulator
MSSNEQTEVRYLKDGDWYWIPRAVIKCYARRIAAVGIAVYNFLASLADSNQSCFPSQKYIAVCLGYSRATISRTLKVLEKNGLIRIERRRYHCVYRLLRVRCEAGETLMSGKGNSEVTEGNTNNKQITRNTNNIDIEDKNFSGFGASKGVRPRTREELLALDLAQALDDPQGLGFYLSYARKYPEPLLRRILGEVKEIPRDRIKKGRGALFNYLVQKYAQEANKNLSP